MSLSFETLNLNPSLIEGLAKQNITTPTTIQAEAIPVILSRQDVIAQSHTGSGKTLAFVTPLFQLIDSSKREMQVLILAMDTSSAGQSIPLPTFSPTSNFFSRDSSSIPM